jgi:hypothetical protein
MASPFLYTFLKRNFYILNEDPIFFLLFNIVMEKIPLLRYDFHQDEDYRRLRIIHFQQRRQTHSWRSGNEKIHHLHYSTGYTDPSSAEFPCGSADLKMTAQRAR